MTKNMPKPDRTIRLADLRAGSLLHRVAAVTIARKGAYTYTDADSGEKVLVLA